ncbi:hypothetical protein [Ammoniphilus sp. CFH 90114]|nr:hypothetical protein [Ammoniphilus sp. CFH 90114]
MNYTPVYAPLTMTYIVDQDERYYPYLDYGIESLLMVADEVLYTFTY